MRRGFTLAELALSATLLLLLLVMNLLVLRTGLSSWAKVDTQADVLQTLQVIGSSWVRETMSSTAAGISLEAQRCSLPSPRDDVRAEETRGVYALLLWRRYRLYYYAGGEVWRRSLDLPQPTDDVRPLESVDLGSGRQSLTYYCVGGRRLAQNVSDCTFSRRGDGLHWRLKAQRQRYGRNQAESVEIEFTSHPRN